MKRVRGGGVVLSATTIATAKKKGGTGTGVLFEIQKGSLLLHCQQQLSSPSGFKR